MLQVSLTGVCDGSTCLASASQKGRADLEGFQRGRVSITANSAEKELFFCKGASAVSDSAPGSEDPLEEGMATHSYILAWRIPWTEGPGGYSPWGCKESDMTEVT